MKKKLFILFLFSFMYSDFINVMIDFDPSYQMISVDNEGVSSYNFEYVDPGITLGYYSDIYKNINLISSADRHTHTHHHPLSGLNPKTPPSAAPPPPTPRPHSQ